MQDAKMDRRWDDLNEKKNKLGFETCWSIHDANYSIVNLDDKVVAEERDMYKIILNLRNYSTGQMCTFTSFSATNTVEGFWKAAESVFQQAKRALDDWHIYIEGFQPLGDGTYELHTGS